MSKKMKMSQHGGVHSCGEIHEHKCHCSIASPSVHQTLDELDFDRGIWNAALAGDEDEVVRKLSLSGGSDVNKTDKSGYSALHYASRNGHLQICKTLLDHKADVNATTQSSRATPLHRAAYMGHAKIISLLLEHGASPAPQDCDGMTPLHKAAENGHAEAVDLLLKADPSAASVQDIKGRKPADLAKCDKIKVKLKV